MTPDADPAAPRTDLTTAPTSRKRRLLLGSVAGTAALAGVGLALWHGSNPVNTVGSAGTAGAGKDGGREGS